MAINNVSASSAVNNVQGVDLNNIVDSNVEMTQKKMEIETLKQTLRLQKEEAAAIMNMMENKGRFIDRQV